MSSDFTKPKTVGRYRRGEKIGYGNFGVVYKGVDTQSGRVVAIKTLDLDAVNDEVESVQHEVELLSHLSMAESSNVTKYYGTVLEGSKLWIVMDLCSGGSVRTLLKAGPLDDRYLGVIFREITIAVVAIHSEGIIHRDIKAANVLITMAGQVKLCDFGVAANTALSGQSKRQTIVGTPYWMAPEVIAEGRSYTNKADIWSMGITFYEIITGNPPYSEHEAMRALMLITNNRPPRLEGPKYTPSLKDLVALCLDEDPEARPGAEVVLKHKFLKNYAKVPTSILRSLVDRYVSWKNAHSDHRDSLLMFNPHKEDDAASILSETDSVWDFNIEEDPHNHEEKSNGVMHKEDLSDAPDSLRELFGIAPKPVDEGIPRLKRTVTEPIRINMDTMTAQTQPDQDKAEHIAGHSAGNATEHTNSHIPNHTPSQTSTEMPSQVLNIPTQSGQTTQETSPTDTSHSNRVGQNDNGPGVPLNRSHSEQSDEIQLLLPDFGPSLRASQFRNGPSRSRSTTISSESSQPPVSPVASTISPAASPKRTTSRRPLLPPQNEYSKPRVNLPRLQMPPRNVLKLGDSSALGPVSAPVSGLSGPSGSTTSRFTSDATTGTTPGVGSNPSNLSGVTSGNTSGNTVGNISGNTSVGHQHSTSKTAVSWLSEFPPMPKIDTNVLLDSTPDEIVADNLRELLTGFKSAMSSLASHLDDSEKSPLRV